VLVRTGALRSLSLSLSLFLPQLSATCRDPAASAAVATAVEKVDFGKLLNKVSAGHRNGRNSKMIYWYLYFVFV